MYTESVTGGGGQDISKCLCRQAGRQGGIGTERVPLRGSMFGFWCTLSVRLYFVIFKSQKLCGPC